MAKSFFEEMGGRYEKQEDSKSRHYYRSTLYSL